MLSLIWKGELTNEFLGAIRCESAKRAGQYWPALHRRRSGIQPERYRQRRAKEAAAVFERKLCAALILPPVRSEPNRPLQTGQKTRKPIPGVPFTDKDPLSWRL
jgi:hypothetical protein